MSGSAREQRPRQAILGQLPRITRADGSPIRVLLVDDEPALSRMPTTAWHAAGMGKPRRAPSRPRRRSSHPQPSIGR